MHQRVIFATSLLFFKKALPLGPRDVRRRLQIVRAAAMFAWTRNI
jgi:hypothetical protein